MTDDDDNTWGDDPADKAWSLSDMDDDLGSSFKLDQDPTFGAGEIEGPPPPPMDDRPSAFDDLGPSPGAVIDPTGLRSADQPLPRITIHASCDRPEVARLIRTVSSDRRMAKAELTVELGGIDAAITRFAGMASPNLLLLDTTESAANLLRALDRLAEVIEEGCKVIIISPTNDIALYRELIRRGVSEYLVTPLQPLQLMRAISQLFVGPDKPFMGRLISVIGAKGGVGASTMAHNLAWCIAERCEANTTLVDLDLPFGTADLDFNNDPAQHVGEALVAPDRVDEVFLERIVTKQTQRLQILAAPAKLDRDYDVDAEAYERVIEQIRRTSPFVVLDLPHLWSGWMRQVLLDSDDVIIVATPDLASLRNTKNILDLMRAARPHDPPPSVVMNMVGIPKRPEVPTKDFLEAINQDRTGGNLVSYAAVIPFDAAAFGAAANNGQMIGELPLGAKLAPTFADLAASLCGRRPEPKKQAPGLKVKLPFLKR